jgi:hypothetical protein
MRVGQARRRDVNEREIVETLRACGCFVVSLSGKDAPDLLVRWGASFWIPMEIKSKAGTVREGQAAAGYPIVRSSDEALALIFQWPTRKTAR